MYLCSSLSVGCGYVGVQLEMLGGKGIQVTKAVSLQLIFPRSTLNSSFTWLVSLCCTEQLSTFANRK